MKTKRLKAILQKEIASRMMILLPEFGLHRQKNSPREIIHYKSSGSNSGYHYISFQFSDASWDAFSVELSWSPLPEWPGDVLPTNPRSLFNAAMSPFRSNPSQARCRIGFLWEPFVDYWWVITPKSSLEDITKWLEQEDLTSDFGASAPSDLENKARLIVDNAFDYILKYANKFFHDFSPYKV